MHVCIYIYIYIYIYINILGYECVHLIMNIFIDNTLSFFVLLWTASPLKTFHLSLHSTKWKTLKRRRLSAIKKLLRFFWLMDMSLPKFNIYQGTVATNCFKNYTNSLCPHFFKKKFCLMSCLKLTLPDVTSSLPDILSGLKKVYSGHMQMVFSTEEFLKVAIESLSEWDLNPWPLNSLHTLKNINQVRV